MFNGLSASLKAQVFGVKGGVAPVAPTADMYKRVLWLACRAVFGVSAQRQRRHAEGESALSWHGAQVAAIVAVMASRFKLALAAGGRKAALERQTLDSTLHLKGGMKMVFVPRASIGFSSRL